VLAVFAILFVLLPIVEITVAIWVAHQIGGLNTVLLLLVFSVAGYYLAKLEGFGVLRRMQEQIENRTVPGNELIEGALVFVGGLLLVIPGFVTDAFGLLLLFPLTRHLATRGLRYRFGIRVRRIGPGDDVIDV
jgi:UPF0716 protein FxsA